jgi:putative oxidoreductase
MLYRKKQQTFAKFRFKHYFLHLKQLTMTLKNLFPTRFAEIIYALVLISFGALHLKYGGGGTGVPSFMPGNPSIWMYISGVGFLLAGIAIIINKFKVQACYMLALMLFIFIAAIHLMPAIKEHSFYQPLKDAGLAMAAIMIGNNASR